MHAFLVIPVAFWTLGPPVPVHPHPQALQAAKARHTELSQQLEELLLGQRAAGAAAGSGGKSRGSGQRKNNRRDASAARSAALSAAAAAVVAAASSDSESEGDGGGGGAQTAAAAKAAEVLRLQQEAAAAEAEHARLKSELSAVDGRRMRHVELAHPYRRFPVEQLERAAGGGVDAWDWRWADGWMSKYVIALTGCTVGRPRVRSCPRPGALCASLCLRPRTTTVLLAGQHQV